MCLKLPKAEGQGAKKEACFAHRNLVIHFFHFFFVHGFTLIKCEVFDFFQEILQGPQC
jgi:hypothetical protein